MLKKKKKVKWSLSYYSRVAHSTVYEGLALSSPNISVIHHKTAMIRHCPFLTKMFNVREWTYSNGDRENGWMRICRQGYKVRFPVRPHGGSIVKTLLLLKTAWPTLGDTNQLTAGWWLDDHKIKGLDNDFLILTIVLLVTQTWRQSQ